VINSLKGSMRTISMTQKKGVQPSVIWHQEQAQRMVNLWRCVLLQALREDGVRYIDTSDGRAVCMLAGHEPSRCRADILAMLPPRRAAKLGADLEGVQL